MAVLVMFAAATAGAAPAALRLLATSPAEVRFAVDVPEAKLAPLADDPASLLLSIEGYDPSGAVGAPGLPGRIVLVALPPTGEVRVSAVASETSTRRDVLLAPVPGAVRNGEMVSPAYVRSDEAYALRGAPAPAWARLIGVGWLRNQRVARIQVLPADYDAPARRLTLARKVEVVVAVAPCAPVTTPAERIDPFEDVYGRLLVNYEQGKGWRRAAGRAGLEALMAGEAGPGGAGPGLPLGVKNATSVYAGREWVKLAISETGMYRVDLGTLRNLRPFQGPVSRSEVIKNGDLRLYSWRSPLPVLPEGDYCDACDYGEVPIGTPGGNNADFTGDNQHSFYFFAMGPRGWADLYDPSRPDTSYFNHPYETKNYYYLTISTAAQPIAGPPLRIAPAIADVDTVGPPVLMTTFPERLHYEQSNEYFPDSPPVLNGTPNASGTLDNLTWQKWFWFSLGQGLNQEVQVSLPGADLTQNVRLRMQVWGLVASVDRVCGFVRNALGVSLNGSVLPEMRWNVKGSVTYDLPLPSPTLTGNRVALSVPNISYNLCSRIGLAWIDLFYQRKLEPVGDSLTFVAPAGTGRAVYRIGPFSSAVPPRVFDVTDPFLPKEVQGSTYQALDPTHYQLAFVTDGAALRRYHVVPDSKIPRLLGPRVFEAPRTSLSDLRQLKADYIVIYYDGFGAAAESLAAWRHSHLPLRGVSAPYDTATVPISAVFDQFSGGRTDPLAVRNFLRAVFLQQGGGVPSRKPSFVTFLGDASYDFKNLLGKAAAGQPACLLPTYENGYDAYVLGGHQFTTDDWLLNVDNAGQIIPDFFAGRIPAADATTAMDVVRNKVLFYERQTPFGEYRNRVMLIADDNFQCEKGDPIGWQHLAQTTTLDEFHTPAHIDRAYIYLHTYPDGAASCTKPAAKAEIRRNLLDGVVMFNYIGHGSPFQLSDESVMIETDVGTLTNGPRYPLFVAASCDVGLFSDPTQTSLGEKLVTTSGGGAIAVISATQLVFSTSNARLNGYIYDQIFDRDPASGGQYHVGLAEALLVAKERASGFGSLTNEMKYQLMGDAGTRLNLPKLWVEIALQDTLGNPITQVRRGQVVKFAGQVMDAPPPGGSPVALNGTASMLIEESAPRLLPPGDATVDYLYRAGPVYRANVAIAAGALAGRFVMPLEAREGILGRARAYATGRAPGQIVDTDAVGSHGVEIVSGVAAAGDNEGPRIGLSFAGGSLEVGPTAVLNVDLFDPSGILITGHSPQNGIIVTVDDNSTTRVDITSSFLYTANSYQGGRATFELANLPLGPHRIKVSAADNLASGFSAATHRSSAVIDFNVVASSQLRQARAYLIPDPASSTGAGRGGQFVVDAPGDRINVLLRIYTVSGKLVRTLRSFGGINQVQLPWDGLDDEQEALANGVYLFKVNVNARESDGRSSSKEHVAAEGRFVVLNR